MLKEIENSISEHKEILNPLTIGVDVDDTILDYALIYFRSIKLGLGIDLLARYREFTIEAKKLPEITLIPEGPAFLDKIVQRFSLYAFAKPIPGAVETLNRWKSLGYKIWFITARQPHLKEVTYNWFEKYGLAWAVPKTKFMPSGDYNSHSDYKNRVVQQLGLHVLIDDRAETLKKVICPTLKAKLGLKKPWNVAFSNNGEFTLVDSWREIDQIVEGIAA